MAAIGRLKRRPEFLRVADARRKWVAPGLILQTTRQAGQGSPQRPAGERVENGGDGDLRVGFTASRKVGNAVARNRARRRLRAAVAEILPRYAKRGHDYVVIARAGTLTRSFDDLVADLTTGLRRLGVYRAAEALGTSPEHATERLVER
ncbi:ribonuclease P protein component [Rhodospirillaceae bacterium SYSU D60014]|uniref:ribonuclease P protein component n=1 Tax=Virgifigura deserti TaxID=2268457 RepID=UPI000E65FC5A